MFYVYCSGNGSLTRPTLSIIISSIISWRLINVLISFHAASRSIHVTQWVERYVAFHYGVYELPWCHLWYFEKKHYFFSHSDESMFHRFYIVIKYLVQRWRKLTGCDWASPPTVNLTSRWCVLDQHFRRHFIGHEDVCCHTLTDIWMALPFHECLQMCIIDSFYWDNGYYASYI